MALCFSVCPDDPSIRCAHEQGHGWLNTDIDDEVIKSAHANESKGCFWDNGFFMGNNILVELTPDQLEALLVFLEANPNAEEIHRVILDQL